MAPAFGHIPRKERRILHTKNRPIRLDGRLNNLPKSEQNGFPDELAWSRLFALLDRGSKNSGCKPCHVQHKMLHLHEFATYWLLCGTRAYENARVS
jgi:hypothetical protein